MTHDIELSRHAYEEVAHKLKRAGYTLPPFGHPIHLNGVTISASFVSLTSGPIPIASATHVEGRPTYVETRCGHCGSKLHSGVG